jgi:hypothetical protein
MASVYQRAVVNLIPDGYNNSNNNFGAHNYLSRYPMYLNGHGLGNPKFKISRSRSNTLLTKFSKYMLSVHQ